MQQAGRAGHHGLRLLTRFEYDRTRTSESQWQVTPQVRGTVYQFWESTVTLNGNQASFVGRSYNRGLQPGGWARFGYCAKL